ncbi:MAG: VacJ family lipoprotein [Pseudomonadota bacterium]
MRRPPILSFGLRPPFALFGSGCACLFARSEGCPAGFRWRYQFALVVLVGFLAVAKPVDAQEDENDPLEPVNRVVFSVNLFFDEILLEPLAIMYRGITPQFFRDAVNNFLDNLNTPVVLANDILQGEPYRAERTLGRFMLNTIMGLGGLIDVGGLVGMPERHSEDFGQTLAVYGVGEGPYLVLPLLGPSNPRDAFGFVVDFAFDPLTYVAPRPIGLARFGTDLLAFREENIEAFNEVKRSSIDLYAATRTLSRQLRAAEIRNGAPPPLDDIYDEDLYDFDDPEESDVPSAARSAPAVVRASADTGRVAGRGQ